MLTVSLSDVARTTDLRIDPHHYDLAARLDGFIDQMKDEAALTWPRVSQVSNGENLPASLYLQDGTTSDVLYASVGAISQFALRPSSCVSLRSDAEGLSDETVTELSARPNEIWITRSGTPGIAWPVLAMPEALTDSRIIPSGFLIRLTCDTSMLEPAYVAAVMNHPVWRVWSSSLAAGKRQRNLSQDHLAAISIPRLALETQRDLGSSYVQALRDVEADLAREQNLYALCDEILVARTGLQVLRVQRSVGLVEQVPLNLVALNGSLRIDHRSVRTDLRSIQEAVMSQPGRALAHLVRQLVRNGQPTLLPVDEQEPPRVIATGSIQFGAVQLAATKQGISEERATGEDRQASSGDLLITMDGEGSIGKAAVFDGDYEAVCDSHVAILRLSNPTLAYAVACFVNSSMGQAQINRLISGATGQLQISNGDLLSLWVPQVILDQANAIRTDYKAALETFEGLVTKVRRRICQEAVAVTARLIEADALPSPALQFLERFQSADELLALLATLKPKMF
jgi:hypothetical protein